MRLDAERAESHPMEVRVGMGINLHPSGSEKPLPRISFISRNQVLIWVSDPTSKSRIRGILVLMSSFVENIKMEEEKVSIYGHEQVELSSGSLTAPRPLVKEEKHKPGTISLSIAQVQHQATLGPNKLRAAVPAFITKLGRRSGVAPSALIPSYEYLARGWDANNNEWRSVLWPALDKHYRPANLEGASTVWKIQCPRKNISTCTETNAHVKADENQNVS
ncbi:hypothetical protein K438DRAFT_913543 [Mycena galopus ATCC 62051]|nr:hypothetical protein K438DRAFT_913543 [Mycena galopus ATCC 62051]